ncbi:WD repeat-containing protein 11 [Cinnamomum micranthum f. kanehirae]|uniref:WD repeat-containing protein 11 n=1 Tax=Cinnamomum micranthum f. kanehirae TaxID=337451 RepID=A0A3S4N6I7_9MAGN|nr:WD repeat-containing protein 11 [Cinnamomum micranthum f. kanehirae]
MSSSSSSSAPRSPHETFDCMLPGPATRSNGGCGDCSATGLLAYGAGSSVVIIDTCSMQLVSSVPMPSPSSTSHSLAPFVTSLRWSPHPLPRHLLPHDPTSSHLLLAVGDRQGRIALLDLRSRQFPLWFDSNHSKLGVQDLCWIRSTASASGDAAFLLASLTGPSLLSLWDPLSGRRLWSLDASPDFLSCIRLDPFDSRHFCVLGLKGSLLSVTVLGDRGEEDIAIAKHQIPITSTDHFVDLQKLEKEAAANPTFPVLAAFPTFFAKCGFSLQWRHVLFVIFPRELVVFDLQYGQVLASMALLRGSAKFMDVVLDPVCDLVYCAHLDGKLSIWKRKEGEQVHVQCTMVELMPSIGTTIPSPNVLMVVACQLESSLQNVAKLYCDTAPTSSSSSVSNAAPDFCSESQLVSDTYFISISDDGKTWRWLLTAEGDRDAQMTLSNLNMVADVSKVIVPEPHINSVDTSADKPDLDAIKESYPLSSTCSRPSNATLSTTELSFKLNLVGQLHLLSSTVATLAVPSPSLTATLARGGNNPAAAVPLVALGTQNGTIDVIDVSANAVAASFSVHNSITRGLRWLGNSRLVSFSYIKVNDKAGGYKNRLVVTCLRSGLNRTFRALQKPERAPIRALRASSSGRYLIILFRDAPVEVWAMTKSPIMLRSLALPFTVLEWTLPVAPRPVQNLSSRQSLLPSKDDTPVASVAATSATKVSKDSQAKVSEGSAEDISESFAFALVNGALGVFEVHGRRIRDFRPKWPSTSFVSSDGLVTAMAYRLPHVVMGDRSGNIRWWDVTSGLSSSFNTHREGIRRIKFSPVVPGDQTRGRIAVLFYDNTFSIFDLDTPDPLANALLQPQFPGTLVLELDWLPLRTDKTEPLVLCIAGADSSFRLIEVIINATKSSFGSRPQSIKERYRPMPLCSPILLPTAHTLALRMILQLGVKFSWFNTCSTTTDVFPHQIPEISQTSAGDLRSYMIDSAVPPVGDSVVPELLLKVLEPYRREGCILDSERARLYATISNKGSAARLAFAAAVFGDSSEALFWLQLPRALYCLRDKSVTRTSPGASVSLSDIELGDMSTPKRTTSVGKSVSGKVKSDDNSYGAIKLMAFKKEELLGNANERILWHENLDGEEAIQKRVHELVSVGNLEAAVTLLLSTPPEGSHFHANALRAVALSSAVSRSLHELAVKVVAANLVRTDKSLSGTHLLCAVGRYQEACSQLQDAGCWTDAATLAATHLQGSDYARVLLRWANHVLHFEHNIWRALILYVAAGALEEALAALRDAQQPDTAAMFLLACHEFNAEIVPKSENSNESTPSNGDKLFVLPGINPEHEDVVAVNEYFGQYQRKLVGCGGRIQVGFSYPSREKKSEFVRNFYWC